MKKVVKSSNTSDHVDVELWMGDDYICTLDYSDGYYKIPMQEAKNLLLDVGDTLTVREVWHEGY